MKPHPSNSTRRRSGRRVSLVLTITVTVCVSLLAALAIAASPAPSPDVIDVNVVPLVTGPGEPVTVEASVHNPLESDADFSVAVLVDDVPEQEQTVRLPAGATRTVRFIVTRSEPGPHVVRVGTQATTFQVLSPQIVVEYGEPVGPGVASSDAIVGSTRAPAKPSAGS